MKRVLTLLLLTIYCTCGRAQNAPPDYLPLVTEAWAAFQANQPRKALKLFDAAFADHPGEAIDLLRAAVIAKKINKHDRALELTDFLFGKYPLEAAVTFLESKEFEFAREEPLYSSMLHLAALRLSSKDFDPLTPEAHQKKTYHYALLSDPYIVLVETAHHAMLAGDYARAHQYYQNAFTLTQRSSLSLLRAAACAYMNKESEVAAGHLEKAFEILPNFTLRMVRLMPEFQKFLDYPQFRILIAKQINRHFPGLDAGLISEIDSLKNLFMTYRQLGTQDSDGVYSLTYSLEIPDAGRRALQDSIDLIISQRIDSILSNRGYPTLHLIADRVEDFDLLTHAILPEVIETHWEIFLAGGEAEKFSIFKHKYVLANRYDANCYRLGRKQKYGCIWFVPESLKETGIMRWPVDNPQLVNGYRTAAGLHPLGDSLKSDERPFNPQAHERVGVLSPKIRDEAHAKISPTKELIGLPFNYQ